MVYAHQVHQNQRRKGTGIPYIAHILGVAALAMEWGCTWVTLDRDYARFKQLAVREP